MPTFAYETWLFIIQGKIQNFCYAIFITICLLISIQKDSDLIFLLASSTSIILQHKWEIRKKSHTALSVKVEQLLIMFNLKYQFCEIVMYLCSYWVDSPYQNWFICSGYCASTKWMIVSFIKNLSCIVIESVAIKLSERNSKRKT